MLDKITIVNENGESIQVDLVTSFNINNKKIVITTKNEIDPNGLVVLNVSELDGDRLIPINNDQDWDAIKQAMRTIISGSDN